MPAFGGRAITSGAASVRVSAANALRACSRGMIPPMATSAANFGEPQPRPVCGILSTPPTGFMFFWASTRAARAAAQILLPWPRGFVPKFNPRRSSQPSFAALHKKALGKDQMTLGTRHELDRPNVRVRRVPELGWLPWSRLQHLSAAGRERSLLDRDRVQVMSAFCKSTQ